MAGTEIVTITNMCMIYDGTKVLVQEKVDDDYSGITFPGGHVEKGESFTDAVIREVYEETGLRISSPVLCGIKDWSNDDGSRYMVLFYKTNKFEGQLSSSDEGEVRWIELEEMKRSELADGMDKIKDNQEFIMDTDVVFNDQNWTIGVNDDYTSGSALDGYSYVIAKSMKWRIIK